jgi:dephospho-CoA kinase
VSEEQARNRPFIIGVTGNIACGKSTVMDELRRLGAETIDADAVYHQLIEPGTPLWSVLVDHFGQAITGSGGRIDRKMLGAMVFGDPRKLRKLEQLTHPAIRAAIRDLIDNHLTGVVAIDAVKLIEGGMHHDCDSVWLVRCRRDQQRLRLMARNGFTPEDAELRIGAQPSIEPKLEIADVHIDNSGGIESTLAQVRRAWGGLRLDSGAMAIADVRPKSPPVDRPSD